MTLLHPQQVAEMLQISVASVRRHARSLGGFYPAHIRVLRFRSEDVERACASGGGLGVQGVEWLAPDLDPGRHGL